VFDGMEFKDLSLELQAELVDVVEVALAYNRQQQEAREAGVPFTEANLAMAMGIDRIDELPPGVYDGFLKLHQYLQR